MTTSGPLSTIFSLLFLLIACFYLFRLTQPQTWIRSFDIENEIGHGMMAMGMALMLAPASLLTPDLIRWNIVLFAAASLWWAVRLFVRKPLLALLLRTSGEPSTWQADAIHVLMYAGMGYMFLLLSSMALSMTLLALSATCLFFGAFTFLLVFSGQEIRKDIQTEGRDWLKLGADLAHVLMNGIMCWMFLEMIAMVMTMRA